ncbi:MAG: zinc-binding dehydrogenase [Reyranellaceae bacterium]
MRAAVVVEQAGAKRIEVQEVPRPEPGPGEVLVRVRAAGANRADLAMNVGHFRGAGAALTAPVAGLEFAGEVAALGTGVTGVREGDGVMAMGQGAFAEYARIDHRLLIPVPTGASWVAAAAAPVALMTMHDAVITNGRLREDEAVLIQGVTSGVGIAAFQIARARKASVVIGTSTSDSKLATMKAAGLAVGINSRTEDVVEAVRKATGGAGADLIIDMLGGPVVNQNMQAAAIRGRIIDVGRMAGLKGEIDLDLHSLKRISLIGVTFRTRSVEEIRTIIRLMVDDLWPDVMAGRISLPIARRFPLEEVADAYAWMRSNAHLGKIVLTL